MILVMDNMMALWMSGSTRLALQEGMLSMRNSVLKILRDKFHKGIWVHVEGYSSPAFGSDGTVTGCDSTGTFIDDVTRFLNTAQENNILVIFTLWNGAYVTNQNEVQLFLDDTKLESYIDNCFQVTSDSDPCYNTTLLQGSGAGWTGVNIPMERVLHFIGRINQAAHEFDPTGIVTLGSWSKSMPLVKASDYQLDKPLLIGEYSSACAAGTSLTDLIEYGYSNGYVGTLDWHWAESGGCSDTRDAQTSSLSYLSGRTENGVVDITVA
ncbi:Mannan endo-1,4-beta-mannosidase [Armadillidium nasatum]|uniref:Mannan endo-1,4-beta-mannosidase n=1 Tax=Armadillidium nasatum TaxID=96803 RepID=A0A5N5TCM1_9CRUS|nr:Mannan endo-1,4-beta-mannosidase [Armadillidium nasatum]